jgi:hypothetical protein
MTPGALPDDLRRIVALWPGLPEHARRTLLDLARQLSPVVGK